MKEDIEELKRLLYTDTLTQCGKRKLINYYEKEIRQLQKENEELKYKYDKALSDLVKVEKESKTFKGFTSAIFNDEIEKEFIPVQKVKDKIEELKEERASKYDNYMGYKIESREQQDINKKIDVLQDLLESEE